MKILDEIESLCDGDAATSPRQELKHVTIHLLNDLYFSLYNKTQRYDTTGSCSTPTLLH